LAHGIHCIGASPLITYNVITENVGNGGAGIDLQDADSKVYGNIIMANSSSYAGGGICIGWESNAEIIQNIIIGNTADLYGGGIDCQSNSSLIKNNIIAENEATSGGGGIFCFNASPTISNNTITANNPHSGNS